MRLKFSFLFSERSVVCFSQGLKNQTLSEMGSSYLNTQSGLAVRQSIGQLSEIGYFSNSVSVTQQGFPRGIQSLPRNLENPFVVIAFPNSFSERISFRFLSKHAEETILTIYDMNGREVFDTILVPVENEIRVNLNHLANGVYLACLRRGNKFFQTLIIKK